MIAFAARLIFQAKEDQFNWIWTQLNFEMDSVKKFNILSGSALIIALLSIYITTLHIDGLARQKYLYKRSFYLLVYDLFKLTNHAFNQNYRWCTFYQEERNQCFRFFLFEIKPSESPHQSRGRNRWQDIYKENQFYCWIYIPVFLLPQRNISSCTRSPSSKANNFFLNFQESQALSVQIESAYANKDYPILAVVREQKSVLSWQLPLLIETASAGP